MLNEIKMQMDIMSNSLSKLENPGKSAMIWLQSLNPKRRILMLTGYFT